MILATTSVDAHTNKRQYTNLNTEDGARPLDYLNILQSILSKKMQPERFNGILLLKYVLRIPNTKYSDVENALVNIIHKKN